MSTSELVPPTTTSAPHTEPAPDTVAEPARRGLQITLEQGAYIALALLAIIAHFWGLGDRALHHDETLHAAYSWRIYVGQGYIHDPLLHGPFLYFFTAAMYFLFGDNDFTARLGVALFGTLLTLSPYLIRRELGRPAALLASVYLLISPAFLYMGRLFRHDMYSMLFEMLVLIAIVRYASTRRPLWLYVGAAAFALMYTNQETSYLFLLIMATPLVLLLLWRAYKPGIPIVGVLGVALALLVFVLPGEAEVDASHTATRNEQNQMIVAEPGPIFGWGPLETEDNAYALRVRNRPDTSGGGGLLANIFAYLADVGLFLRHPAILLGISLLIASSTLLLWLIWLRRDAEGRSAWARALAHDDGVLSGFGSLLHDRRWLVALLIFLAIYALLFTAFFTNLIGAISGTTGSLLYWLAQHNVERGGQPPYYYLVLLGIYEPLALLWASVGLAIVVGLLLRRWRWRPPPAEDGDATDATPPPLPLLPMLLAWWSVMALGIYSWAGERMPWLLVHVALPQVLLGAWALQRVLTWGFRERPWPQSRRSFALFASFFALVVALAYIQITAYIGSGGQTNIAPQITLLLTLILLGLLLLSTSLLEHWRWALAALALCVTVAGGFYTVRNAYRVSYELGDTPREMLIYTQTSPDVMRVVRGLEDISRLRTDGLDMPILYDNETVWTWYLRDFTNASGGAQNLTEPPADDVQAVLLLSEHLASNPELRDHLAGFRIQRFPLRWWFPETTMYHKTADWREVELTNASLLTRLMRAPFDDRTLVQVWGFLLHREFDTPLGSTDFVIAVRPEIADQLSPGLGAETRR
jgi:predicted membrane-bound mannosyltransferase